MTLEELELLKQAAGLTTEDMHQLGLAGEVLGPQAGDMVDTWRAILAGYPHLARYALKTDGSPNPEYGAASKPRFVQWINDLCAGDWDQEWLDYQETIGRRHTRAEKNKTDNADSPDHIPLRYVLGFLPVVILTTKDFLASKGHSPDQIESMHAAWTKAVTLAVTIWTTAYTREGDW